MTVRTILVCEAQVPFVTGGAESLARSLVGRLRAAGYETDLVSVPYKWYPKDEILAHAAAWRLLDLSEASQRPVDLLIATKFPTYFTRHPNKVVWLLHQHRAAYELCGSDYSDFTHTDEDVGLRARLHDLDREMLSECGRRYTIKAMRHADEPLRLLIAGAGRHGESLRRTASAAGVTRRVEFLGRVSDQALVDLYANALAVVYPPYDEDYGYVTLEAFLARKPVVSATDAGGPLEFVEHEVSGLVCEPDADAFAAAFNSLADRARARALGDAAYERARGVTWDGVIEELVSG